MADVPLQDVRWSTRKRKAPEIYSKASQTIRTARGRTAPKYTQEAAPDPARHEMSGSDSGSQSDEPGPSKSLKHASFTDEDDMHLVWYLSVHLPDNSAEGRSSIMLYNDLLQKASENEKYRWASRHSAARWKARYKTLQSVFDAAIDKEIVRRQQRSKAPISSSLANSYVCQVNLPKSPLGKRKRPKEDHNGSDRSISVPVFLKQIRRDDEPDELSSVSDRRSASTTGVSASTRATSVGKGKITMHEDPASTGEEPKARKYNLFTPKEETLLAEYIAEHLPDAAEGGRMSIAFYQSLTKKASTHHAYSWALTHSAASWCRRYAKKREWFDDAIEKIVASKEDVHLRYPKLNLDQTPDQVIPTRVKAERSKTSNSAPPLKRPTTQHKAQTKSRSSDQQLANQTSHSTSSTVLPHVKGSYTAEEDLRLAEYLLELHLSGDVHKRGGMTIYDDLVFKGEKDEKYRWATARIASAWNYRYRSNRELFDAKVEKLARKAERRKQREKLNSADVESEQAMKQEAPSPAMDKTITSKVSTSKRPSKLLPQLDDTSQLHQSTPSPDVSVENTHASTFIQSNPLSHTGEESSLAEYLAEHLPNNATKRLDLGFYEYMVEKGYDTSILSWTLKHTASGWLECYKSKREWFDKTIANLVMFRQEAQSWPQDEVPMHFNKPEQSAGGKRGRKVSASSKTCTPRKNNLIRNDKVDSATKQRNSVKNANFGSLHSQEDDERLARYIAECVPDKDAGGRSSLILYTDLVERAKTDSNYSWAATRTPWGWFGRYRKMRDWFDAMIEKIVAEKHGREVDEETRRILGMDESAFESHHEEAIEDHEEVINNDDDDDTMAVDSAQDSDVGSEVPLQRLANQSTLGGGRSTKRRILSDSEENEAMSDRLAFV